MRVKEESEKAGLKLNIKKTKIMAFGPITSWQTEGEKVEAATDFLSLGSKIMQMVTAAMKLEDNCFLTGKLDSVLKSKDITFLSVPYSQGYGLPSNHVWI